MNGHKKEKGFFSVFTAALSVFVLVFAATAAISLFDYHQATLADLQAKVLSDKFDDVSKMFNATVEDALMDYAYGTEGCARVFDRNFCGPPGNCNEQNENCAAVDPGDLVESYFQNLAGAFGSSFNITADVSQDDCGNGVLPNVNLDGIDYRNKTVTFSAQMTLESSGNSRSFSRTITRLVYVAPEKDAGQTFYLRILDEAGADLKNLSVVCS